MGRASIANARRGLGPGGGRRAVLGALGAISALVYAAVAFGLRFSNEARDVGAFLAVFAFLFALYAGAALAGRALADERSALRVVLAFALVFRLVMLFAGLPPERPLEALGRDLSGRETGYAPFLIYDNDVWRYLWDGRVGAHGVSPWAVSPRRVADLAADGERPFTEILGEEVWWDVLDNVSFQGHTTVYPPASQALFRLSHRLAPGSVFAWKALVVAVDLATCWGLVLLLGAVGRRRSEVIHWAWNPLVLKELAGSGHADGLMIGLLTWAVFLLVRRRQLSALAAYGTSILAKLGSAGLAVLFLRRTRPRAWPVLAAVLVLGSLPLVGEAGAAARGLGVYGRDWVFNSGPWAALRGLAAMAGAADPALWAHIAAKTLTGLAIVVLPLRAAGSPRSIVRTAFAVTAVVVLLNPAVMPWYLLWALPVAVAAGCRSWTVLTAVSLLSYLIYLDGTEHAWWLWLEYGLFAGALAVEVVRARRRGAGDPDRGGPGRLAGERPPGGDRTEGGAREQSPATGGSSRWPRA